MKIKIKSKGFNTTHYGFLAADSEPEVSSEFGKYCVEKMRAAEYVSTTKPRRRRFQKKSVDEG